MASEGRESITRSRHVEESRSRKCFKVIEDKERSARDNLHQVSPKGGGCSGLKEDRSKG